MLEDVHWGQAKERDGGREGQEHNAGPSDGEKYETVRRCSLVECGSFVVASVTKGKS